MALNKAIIPVSGRKETVPRILLQLIKDSNKSIPQNIQLKTTLLIWSINNGLYSEIAEDFTDMIAVLNKEFHE